MTVALICGAVVGLGLFALVRALFPARPGLLSSLALYDSSARRRTEQAQQDSAGSSRGERIQGEFGKALARFYEARGWEQRSVKSDLSLVGKEYEAFLATKMVMPVVALVFIPLFVAVAALSGEIPIKIPLWFGLMVAVVFFFFPDLQLRQEAAKARDDFRHVVGAFLDLVAMNLAGGRGVPEALMTASNVGDSMAMRRLREALANARISGHTPWQALGTLGEEIGVAELCDLSAALGLVADDGAKVRQSLGARAASMRSREISAIEGKAGQNSQTMLIAQLLFCLGFLIFLIFPSLMQIYQST
jgi:Flp pilus assembly protein TadB